MKQFEARIESNREVAPRWRELVLSWDPGAGRPLPGQFMTLRATARHDPLLRRPLAFSGASFDAARVSAVYQVRGSATLMLSELAPGSALDLLGPLGRPFPAPDRGERPLLAAGGIGLGPVLYLARELGAAGLEPLLAVGFRDKGALPDIELPAGAVVCTDDGSAGFRGFPPDWMSRNVPASTRARLYGCGPGPMLAALASLATSRGWAASLSAEQWMACGVGACMGCVLPRTGGGYLRACADGPVFERDEIDWAAEATR